MSTQFNASASRATASRSAAVSCGDHSAFSSAASLSSSSSSKFGYKALTKSRSRVVRKRPLEKHA